MTLTAVTDGKTVHVVPSLDVIVHTPNDKCPCKPEHVETAKGDVYTHVPVYRARLS